MIDYKHCFVPPKEYEKNEINSEWTRAFIIDEVCRDYPEEEKFKESRIANWESMLVAYTDDRIIGFQLCDYDHHEMNIMLGYQILSLTLTEEEKEGLEEHFGHEAKMRFEDLF